MKPGALLINTARGGLVNEQAWLMRCAPATSAAQPPTYLTQEPPKDGNVLLAADIPRLIITRTAPGAAARHGNASSAR